MLEKCPDLNGSRREYKGTGALCIASFDPKLSKGGGEME